MDHHEQEPLNQQPRSLQPERRLEGLLSTALAAVIAVGLAAGGFLFADRPSATASDQAKTTLAFFMNGSGSTSQQ
jgi:hypothetical protein